MDTTHDTLVGIVLIISCSIVVVVLWYKKMLPRHVNLHEVHEIPENLVKLV